MSSGTIPSLVAPTYTSFPYAVAATSDAAYSFGAADGVLITATITGTQLTLTKLDDTTVACGFPVIGTYIPIASKKAVWGSGSLVAVRARA